MDFNEHQVGPDAPVGCSESEHRARRGGFPPETSNKVYVNKKAICDYDQCPGVVGRGHVCRYWPI
jgi:hypothetical protein